jgi:C4-dicarboxylate-specific signal transduction histidine kinase
MLPSFRFPIRYKLVALSLIVALTPLTLATVLARGSIEDVERQVVTDSRSAQEARVGSMARLLDERLQGLISEATVAAALPDLRDALAANQEGASKDRARAALLAIAKKDAAHEAAALITRDGQVLVSSAPAEEGSSVRTHPSVQGALKGSAHLSDISLDAGGGTVLYASAPVEANGQVAGVLRLRLNPSIIAGAVVADAPAHGADAATMLVDETGLRLALSDARLNQTQRENGLMLTALTETSDETRRRWTEEQRFGGAPADAAITVNPDPALWAAISGGQTGAITLEQAGEKTQVASAALTVKPWRYVSVMPDSSVTATTDSMLSRLIRISVSAAIGAVLFAFLFSLSLTRPLVRLARAVDEVSMGDTDVTVESRSNDEIGDLAAAFSRMVASLRFYSRKSGGQNPQPDNPLNFFDRAA